MRNLAPKSRQIMLQKFQFIICVLLPNRS
uniref:Uncharacterized protein n=1 Tax=Arundo donax TaxID=35708 RepID=A0A0A8YY87_ARUDO